MLLNTSTNVSVSTVLGEKDSNVKQSWGAGAKFAGRRQPAHWTGRWQLNEGVMFCELRVLLFVCFRSVHGCMGMDVWVNVFTLSFLCADSGPWRTMSMAWPPMSAMTTSSGSTCPSPQESAWWAAEARQERVIVEVVRKAIVVGKCWSLYWTYLQMFSVSTVLGEKASYVEQSWEASAKLPGLRAPPFWSGRGLLNERVTYSELTVLLFAFGVCMGGWEWMCESMFVFTMPFLCADSGPWRTMSRADHQCPR